MKLLNSWQIITHSVIPSLMSFWSTHRVTLLCSLLSLASCFPAGFDESLSLVPGVPQSRFINWSSDQLILTVNGSGDCAILWLCIARFCPHEIRAPCHLTQRPDQISREPAVDSPWPRESLRRVDGIYHDSPAQTNTPLSCCMGNRKAPVCFHNSLHSD